ncbi:MAG: hypothetical protein NE334_07405 [Lentisphaeraceae bacterium]|nr:hypothetical protein [Lentisphaeraceae bacterium]
MSFLDIFKKKKTCSVKDEHSFSDKELAEWPSVPVDGTKVPTIEQVKKFGGVSGKSAELVIEACEKFKKEGDYLEYQPVMESQYGLFTVPAMIRREDGTFRAFYSTSLEWSESEYQKLLNWVICVRGCDFIHTFKIIVCQNDSTLPKKVEEIVSDKAVHRMMINQIPHFRKGNNKVNSRVFAEAFGFHFNDNKILNFDFTALEQIENWYKKQVISCQNDSFYYPFYVQFIAAYFGRVLCEAFKVDWQEVAGGEVVVIPGSKLKPRKHGRASGDMKVNVMQIVADFVLNPRLENSLVTNYKMIDAEVLKEA